MNNFIFIFYEKNKKNADRKCNFCYSQINLLKISLSRIRFLYPASKIHLLTNIKENLFFDFDFLHFFDFDSNHLIKFYIYGLLNEESIYLDSDVLVKRKFKFSEIQTNFNFRLFNTSGDMSIPQISQGKYFKKSKVYNAGVVYIKKPEKKITETLFDIENKFFKDKKKLIEQGFWPYNDEYSLSIFLNDLNIYFEDSVFVNVPIHKISFKLNDQVQSIHYTGKLNNKKKYFKDYVSFFKKLII